MDARNVAMWHCVPSKHSGTYHDTSHHDHDRIQPFLGQKIWLPNFLELIAAYLHHDEISPLRSHGTPLPIRNSDRPRTGVTGFCWGEAVLHQEVDNGSCRSKLPCSRRVSLLGMFEGLWKGLRRLMWLGINGWTRNQLHEWYEKCRFWLGKSTWTWNHGFSKLPCFSFYQRGS